MGDQRFDRTRGDRMSAPHFSLQRLLLSMTLIAVGIAAISHMWTYNVTSLALALVCLLGGGASLGAGIMALFGNAKLGAATGFLVMAGVTLWLMLKVS